METLKDVQKHELASSIVWITEAGIVYSIPRSEIFPDLSVEEIKEEMEKFKAVIGTEKVCMIVESSIKSKLPQKEPRELIASELAQVTRAMAIINTSNISRIVAVFFFALNPPPYPLKMFTNKQDAENWIKQYV